MSGNPFEQQRKGNEGDGGGAWDGSNAGGATVVRVNDDNDDDDATEFSNPFAPPPSDSGRDGGGGGGGSQRSGGGASPAKQQRATSSTNTNANAKKAADAYEAPTGSGREDSGMDTFSAYGGAYDNAAATTNAATTQQEKKGAGGLFGGGFGFGAFGGGGGGGSSGGGDKSLAAQRKELEKRGRTSRSANANSQREKPACAPTVVAEDNKSITGRLNSGRSPTTTSTRKFLLNTKKPCVCVTTPHVCLFLALFMNLLAVTGAFITDGRIVSWLMAIIYFVVGVPGAYFIWYRRLYMRDQKRLGFKIPAGSSSCILATWRSWFTRAFPHPEPQESSGP